MTRTTVRCRWPTVRRWPRRPRAALLAVSGLGHSRLLPDPQVIDSAVGFLRTGRRPAAYQRSAVSHQPSAVSPTAFELTADR